MFSSSMASGSPGVPTPINMLANDLDIITAILLSDRS